MQALLDRTSYHLHTCETGGFWGENVPCLLDSKKCHDSYESNQNTHTHTHNARLLGISFTPIFSWFPPPKETHRPSPSEPIPRTRTARPEPKPVCFFRRRRGLGLHLFLLTLRVHGQQMHRQPKETRTLRNAGDRLSPAPKKVSPRGGSQEENAWRLGEIFRDIFGMFDQNKV